MEGDSALSLRCSIEVFQQWVVVMPHCLDGWDDDEDEEVQILAVSRPLFLILYTSGDTEVHRSVGSGPGA